MTLEIHTHSTQWRSLRNSSEAHPRLREWHASPTFISEEKTWRKRRKFASRLCRYGQKMQAYCKPPTLQPLREGIRRQRSTISNEFCKSSRTTRHCIKLCNKPVPSNSLSR